MQNEAQVFPPLDKRWGLDESSYSPERNRQMVWLSGLLPYEQAAQVLPASDIVTFRRPASGGKRNDMANDCKAIKSDN